MPINYLDYFQNYTRLRTRVAATRCTFDLICSWTASITSPMTGEPPSTSTLEVSDIWLYLTEELSTSSQLVSVTTALYFT